MAEFATTTIGAHKIEVLVAGQHIRGSPFVCQSFAPDEMYVVDSPRDTRASYYSGKPAQFKLDRRNAGLAELDLLVTSPVGNDLPVEVKGLHDERGVDLVEFKPEVGGWKR